MQVGTQGAMRIGANSVGLPLHDLEATRRIESWLLQQQPHGALMARAGRAVARWVAAMAPHARRILVLAGPGGNGGDALHAAAHLAAWGRQVTIVLAANPSRLRADARQGHEAAITAGVRHADLDAWPDCDLVVDGLLGIGSTEAPRGEVLHALTTLHQRRVPTLAIDLPTGLHPMSGAATCDVAVRAQATLSLLTLRPGLFTGAGREHAGDIWLDALGPHDPAMACTEPLGRLTGVNDHPDRWLQRRQASHKGSHGDVWVIGGASGMTGALRMAAAAAQGLGAGRTIVMPLDTAATGCGDALHPEWIWRDPRALHAELPTGATVVCGCGGGDAVESVLPRVLQSAPRLVLDADALNAVARQPNLRLALRSRASDIGPTVVTPHPLEAARLLGITTHQVQRDRIAAACQLATDLRATVVLKGSGTIVATSPAGHAEQHIRDDVPTTEPKACKPWLSINTSGGPALATAGSGDVLAGAIAGLWSQAVGSALAAPVGAAPAEPLPHRVACTAVWLHGRAVDAVPSHLPALPAELVGAMRSVAA